MASLSSKEFRSGNRQQNGGALDLRLCTVCMERVAAQHTLLTDVHTRWTLDMGGASSSFLPINKVDVRVCTQPERERKGATSYPAEGPRLTAFSPPSPPPPPSPEFGGSRRRRRRSEAHVASSERRWRRCVVRPSDGRRCQGMRCRYDLSGRGGAGLGGGWVLCICWEEVLGTCCVKRCWVILVVDAGRMHGAEKEN